MVGRFLADSLRDKGKHKTNREQQTFLTSLPVHVLASNNNIPTTQCVGSDSLQSV